MEHAICHSSINICANIPDICYSSKNICANIPTNLFERCISAIDRDDKDEFLKMIHDPEWKKQQSNHKITDYIFWSDAPQIASTVINGETKGIIDTLVDGITPLHRAALAGSPRLVKYLLESGEDVDAICDYATRDGYLKQVTPLDLAIQSIGSYGQSKMYNSLFRLLSWFCHNMRCELEVVRLLLQKSQNVERAREVFINYADKGQLVHLAALLFAAPEMFMSLYLVPLGGGASSLSMSHHLSSNSLEKRSDIEQDGVSLLFDVFAMVGDKLAAYIRLEETSERILEQKDMEIDFLLREVAPKKLGVSCIAYYFRFFKPLGLHPRRQSSSPYQWDLQDPYVLSSFKNFKREDPGPWMFFSLSSLLSIKDIDQAYIYSLLPILEPDDAERLNRAIEKKLSSMPTLNATAEDMTRLSKRGEKHLTQFFRFGSGGNFEHKSLRNSQSGFDFEFTPITISMKNMIQKTKNASFFPSGKLLRIPMILKRLIK